MMLKRAKRVQFALGAQVGGLRGLLIVERANKFGFPIHANERTPFEAYTLNPQDAGFTVALCSAAVLLIFGAICFPEIGEGIVSLVGVFVIYFIII